MTEERSFRVVLETPEGLRSISCDADQYVLDAAAFNGIDLPFICRQGRCLTCAARLLEGSVEHDQPDSYYPVDQAAGYILLCHAMPRTDLRILTHQEWQMRDHRISHSLPAPYA
jgi:ferredoxin